MPPARDKHIHIDEFHLLGENGRGATMESLVTRLLFHAPNSSSLALTATIGGLDDLAGWLVHCGKPVRVLESSYQFHALRRLVIKMEDKDAFFPIAYTRLLLMPRRCRRNS